MLKNKKAGMEISIVLLVIATLVLTTFSLYTFYTKQKSIEEKIYITRFLEDIYSKEEIINFYIDNILEKSIKNSSGDENKIIENFKQELGNYKNKDGKFIVSELSQIEEQVSQDNIKIENGKAVAEFEIMLKGNVAVKEKKAEKELFSAIYTYKKKFEKNIFIETPSEKSSVIVDLTKKVEIPGSNTVYDGYYIYFDGVQQEFFLIETLQGYIIMKKGSGDYYAQIEKEKDWRIVTYPDLPLPEYLQGKKFYKEGEIIYFK